MPSGVLGRMFSLTVADTPAMTDEEYAVTERRSLLRVCVSNFNKQLVKRIANLEKTNTLVAADTLPFRFMYDRDLEMAAHQALNKRIGQFIKKFDAYRLTYLEDAYFDILELTAPMRTSTPTYCPKANPAVKVETERDENPTAAAGSLAVSRPPVQSTPTGAGSSRGSNRPLVAIVDSQVEPTEFPLSTPRFNSQPVLVDGSTTIKQTSERAQQKREINLLRGSMNDLKHLQMEFMATSLEFDAKKNIIGYGREKYDKLQALITDISDRLDELDKKIDDSLQMESFELRVRLEAFNHSLAAHLQARLERYWTDGMNLVDSMAPSRREQDNFDHDF
jgi:hypothetical protein